MSNWQPIETAPKGISLLGITPSGNYRIGEAYEQGGPVFGLIDRMAGRWAVCSHWMPLPEPPEVTS